MCTRLLACILLVLVSFPAAFAAEPSEGDRMIAAYFRDQTKRLQQACLADIQTLEQWNARRGEYRRQLLEMLGLDPLPERTDLHATITGQSEKDGVVVENIHFQSRPHLYVTGNLYRPAKVDAPLPAILYVCGHGGVKKDGISYGNKVHYQHHGAWFAKNGYVCLTIDSLQLGEIEGIHHGTYRYDMWWWLNRGYTPAGVEAWNCIRALDYLQSRPEVDGQRMGVTGRSGGGAYSWWIAAIDERIRAAVPVAGITDLENHVVDGCVEGHCDCMYMVNTYQWDYPQVAALVAPRPLLISNSDRDSIFPLEGVVRTHRLVRKIYDLYSAREQLALQITAGPHQDTQELRVHAFRWFNHYLKHEDAQIDSRTEALFTPEELRVFRDGLPSDALNATIAESFVPTAPALSPPTNVDAWRTQVAAWREQLRAKVFRAWPDDDTPPLPRLVRSRDLGDFVLEQYAYVSQPEIELPMYVVRAAKAPKDSMLYVHVADESSWRDVWQAAVLLLEPAPGRDADAQAKTEKELRDTVLNGHSMNVIVVPRGIGPTAWSSDPKPSVQIRRRFYLLGQTLDGQRIWDIRQAIHAACEIPSLKNRSNGRVQVASRGVMAANALYASLFSDKVTQLELVALPASHAQGPYLLNVDRVLPLSAALAMAAEQSRTILRESDPSDWTTVTQIGQTLKWPADRLVIVQPAN